jgi:hypothetical protein
MLKQHSPVLLRARERQRPIQAFAQVGRHRH